MSEVNKPLATNDGPPVTLPGADGLSEGNAAEVAIERSGIPSSHTVEAAEPEAAEPEADRSSVGWRLGRATRQIARGQWAGAADSLRLATWLGQYGGFAATIVFGIFLIARIQVAITHRELPFAAVTFGMVLGGFARLAMIFIGATIFRTVFGTSIKGWWVRGGPNSVGVGLVQGAVLATPFVLYMLGANLFVNLWLPSRGGVPLSVSAAVKAATATPASTPQAEDDRRFKERLNAPETDPAARAAALRGWNELTAGRPAEAERAATEALAIEPTLWPAYWIRGNARVELEDFTAAVGDYNVALTLDPGNRTVRYTRAVAKFMAGQVRDALADAEAAQIEAPGPLHMQGSCHRLLGDQQQAIALYDRALEMRPGVARVLADRASSLLALKRYEEAFLDAARAIAADPGLADAYYVRATARRSFGDERQALEDLSDATRLAPEDALPHMALAYLRLDALDSSLHDAGQAVEHARRACELSDWEDHVYVTLLARSHAKAGNATESRRFSRMALDLAPEALKAQVRRDLSLPDPP